MSDSLIFILAGGKGTRLAPLTEHRCKPAVPFGGRYRLIDVAISNALKAQNSDIYIVTQFLSESLISYVEESYEQTLSHLPAKETYEGTADSIAKNISILEDSAHEYVTILSGDQLYDMDLKDMLSFTKEKDADLTIATIPINEEEATRMGIMKIDKNSKITDFIEKPQDPKILQEFSLQPKKSEKITSITEKIFLGSMGIYIFKKSALISLLKGNYGTDFGKNIIPEQLNRGNCCSYVFSDYWEDIGTIKSYFHANLKLTYSPHSLNIFNKSSMLLTGASTLPPSLIEDCQIHRSIITDGCTIYGKSISNSLIGVNTKIGNGSVLNEVLSLGTISNVENTSIGENCFLERVIIDENVTIEDGVILKLPNHDMPDQTIGPISIIDNIIVIKEGSRIPKNFSMLEKREKKTG